MSRSPAFGLVVLCLPMLIVSMDVSVLFFAVPYLAADLTPSPTQELWIFDIYGFVLAGLLLTMGSAADRIGHRRLLLWGAIAFSAASVAAAFAVSAPMLIGARALLGVAGATLMPSTLALIRHLFVDDAARAKAVATWNAVLAGGVAVGPIVSGLLLEHFWWGSVFLINVPVMVALLCLAPLVLPGDTAVPGRRVDGVSALLALGALLPIIGGIKELAIRGFTFDTDDLAAWPVVAVVVGLIVGTAFIWRQHRLDDPLVDLDLLRERRFGTSIAANLVCMFGMLGNSIIMTQYLQSVLDYSPLRAALWSLAPTVVVGAVAPVAAVLAGRVGRPPLIVGGLLVAAGGFVVLATTTGVDTLATVLVGAGLLASGIIAATSMIADYVVGVAPADRVGATSGLLETSSELGGALGIAILGSVLNAVFRASFASGVVPGAEVGSLPEAVAVAGRLPAEPAQRLLDAACAAFVDGLIGAAWVGAATLTLTAIVVAYALTGRGGSRRSPRIPSGSTRSGMAVAAAISEDVDLGADAQHQFGDLVGSLDDLDQHGVVVLADTGGADDPGHTVDGDPVSGGKVLDIHRSRHSNQNKRQPCESAEQ
ncbi:MFS transporter [Gordonia sp. ABSL1-1]|uniref:MFS transporter n=1 Tax=Gordonia sp. ABSL1-1 TaxID=3053923 RepID=UPI00257239A2|nr:MFS transporter [Gordonia sp. ABSL1-1]MDL9937340.1 MFS transporter [Gordonia sp. ABSL1-1]